jgi:hypothetical protein
MNRAKTCGGHVAWLALLSKPWAEPCVALVGLLLISPADPSESDAGGSTAPSECDAGGSTAPSESDAGGSTP